MISAKPEAELVLQQQKSGPDYECVVVGAGVCGIYQIYRLSQMGIKSLVIEAGGDVGGTWYWNRYPGARFDSESVTYGYSFSPELLQEWNWSERFAARPETESYLRYVVGKFDLRQYMRFNTRLDTARFHEEGNYWALELSDGAVITTRFLLTAVGMLSAPTKPRYKGVEQFKGISFHTYNAPAEGVDLRGKRVAVIGTGATGVQLIADIKDKVGDLTVFQRRPNWCAPLGNAPITEAEMADYKTRYDDIFERCRNTVSGFWHVADPRKSTEVPREERLKLWERLYDEPGFGIWLGNFRDILYDDDANKEITEFIAGKIRARVNNPAIADQLIPKDHGFGQRRVPLEMQYYEAYNQDNVHLVSLSETPIEEITETGIRTTDRDYPFDVIIYATGFDAITGAYDRIEIIGRDGVRLRDKWADGPSTALGVMTTGFPNFFTVAGPQSGSVATNFPRGIEEAVEFVTDFVEHLIGKGCTVVEPRQEIEDEWQEEVRHQASRVAFGQQKSWFTGYNSNVDREYKNRYIAYVGGALRYRARLQEQITSGYSGFGFK